MKPITHLAVSLVLAIASFFIFHSMTLPLIIIFAGVLIDTDHFIDYVINEKTLKGALKRLITGKYFYEKETLIQIFHGYEWVILIFVLSPILGLNAFFMGISVLIHLIMDVCAYKPRLIGYFLIFRIIKSFDLKVINPKQFISLKLD